MAEVIVGVLIMFQLHDITRLLIDIKKAVSK